MTPPLTKTIIRVTILHPTDDAPRLGACSLGEIGYEIDEGDWLGNIETISATSVPPEDVAAQEKSLGSDGSFFEHD